MAAQVQYMRRALELATLGRGQVSPNPMVGCVIVHEPTQRIIGEGWHQRYGEAHAERNAIQAIHPDDLSLLPDSTAYVTLEPCSHYGKQPPCANLLIEMGVGRVVCCNDDPNPLVGGQGFQKLEQAGIRVERGLLAEEGRLLNARFFTFMEQQRPYIILKWAETSDGFIGGPGGQPVSISGPKSQRLVHKWRSEEDAIMVGTNTARNDNPRLNTRLWPIQAGPGKNPIRIVIDRHGTLPDDLHLFDGSQRTIILKSERVNRDAGPERKSDLIEAAECQPLEWINANFSTPESLFHSFTLSLFEQRITSVLVEGGAALLNSFLAEGLWDEMRVFRSPKLLGDGVKAPTVQGRLICREMIGDDELTVYRPV
ncbi:bifunctional diaminohydroxyphosphoribosylaminopyrimidine deaminase/5-amino-6-(5-phosphoribosylamino)uracil reductase RibD [Spirosoma rhododendri]|uniref:Riboflavin biosynthesis protein RibD n=2 Tax=Spirosoma rhododendri TaxID=2728024 RepID=A0A7L5DXI6_9BACT|nr:bifunctional diaminohydroxyphosphoribosylaminopyrimidine deaminase/5-amino-6-(5-phosphoribosylamino)uracil reductase RibD [Spirosoma rhododendri]